MIKLLAGALILTMSLPLAAQAEIKGCYERVYDAAHLKKHPKQKVTRIKLQYGFESGPDMPESDMNSMDVWLRGSKTRYYAVPICEAGTKPLHCGIEEDGGTFTLEEQGDSLKLTNASYMRVLDPKADDEEGIELQPDAEHKVFMLHKTSSNRCSRS